jgi:hypothetical protein
MTVDYGSAHEADAGDVTWDVHRFAALLLHPAQAAERVSVKKRELIVTIVMV